MIETAYPQYLSATGVRTPIGPREADKWEALESLIRADYERSSGETLADLKRRGCFSREDRALLREWMRVAKKHAAASREKHGVRNSSGKTA